MCLVRFKNTNERNINNEIAFFGYFVFYKDLLGELIHQSSVVDPE